MLSPAQLLPAGVFILGKLPFYDVIFSHLVHYLTHFHTWQLSQHCSADPAVLIAWCTHAELQYRNLASMSSTGSRFGVLWSNKELGNVHLLFDERKCLHRLAAVVCVLERMLVSQLDHHLTQFPTSDNPHRIRALLLMEPRAFLGQV